MANLSNKIFIDAKVFIAAALSPTGGSFRLINEAVSYGFSLFASQYVFEEVFENIKQKFPEKILELKHLLSLTSVELLKSPTQKEVENAFLLVHPKDAPIIATAIKNKMDFLITLDKEHFLKNPSKKVPTFLKILTPGDFLQKYFHYF
ncbi:MAG: putative toxin-antitoxin system toxin component, PIN family [bacterium]|nr:putative toxin-antitoxin system toxin component, PIN family [bacterium]